MSSRERPRSPPGPQGKPPRGGRPGILLGGREPGVVSRSVLVPLVDSREYLRFLVQGPAGALAFSRGVPILPRVVSARTTDTWARGVRSRFGARPSAPTRCQAAGHALASARDPDLAPPPRPRSHPRPRWRLRPGRALVEAIDAPLKRGRFSVCAGFGCRARPGPKSYWSTSCRP